MTRPAPRPAARRTAPRSARRAAMGALALAGCSSEFRTALDEQPNFGVATAQGGDVYVPHVAINEVQSDNESTVMHGGFAFPDWVELVNGDDAAVPLSRLSLADASGAAWTGPEGATIAPGEHLLLWADGDPGDADSVDGDGADALPFHVDADGETLTLTLDGAMLVDEVTLPALDGDTSWARFPDGGDGAVTSRPTPGATNGAAATPGDPSDALFDVDRTFDVYLTLDDAAIAALNADPYGEVKGGFAMEGAFFPDVNIRLKGVYGTLRNLSQKCSFKVDLDDYADHRLRGLETLAFNNLVQDPTYAHEALVYTLFRAMGVPAPRVGYARVTLNGTGYGLYAFIEYPDDRLLARWFADETGNLYEGAYGVDFTYDYLWSFDQDQGADDNDRADLTALIAALDVPPDDAGLANLAQYVNLDEFTAEMAVEAVAYHWDGYTTANNYRVYHDPSTGQFSMIPWGADQTFHDARYEAYEGGGRLFDYCMANAGCVAMYTAKLLQAAALVESLDLAGELPRIEAAHAADIAADPRREWGLDVVQQYVSETAAVIAATPARIQAEARQ